MKTTKAISMIIVAAMLLSIGFATVWACITIPPCFGRHCTTTSTITTSITSTTTIISTTAPTTTIPGTITTTIPTTTIQNTTMQQSNQDNTNSGGIPCAVCAQMFASQFGGNLQIRFYNPYTKTIWILTQNGIIYNTYRTLS